MIAEANTIPCWSRRPRTYSVAIGSVYPSIGINKRRDDILRALRRHLNVAAPSCWLENIP